jgi:hypothetical protein
VIISQNYRNGWLERKHRTLDWKQA